MSTCGLLDRAQQAVGHLLSILVERRVHRGDDDVERGEAVVGEIERAVGHDVALDAGEDRTPTPSASSARMRAACASARRSSRPLAIASDWLWSVMAMYSSPASRAAAAIVRDVVLAVGLGGVHVEVAAQIGARSMRRGQRVAPAAASISPRISRSSGGIQSQAERRVDVFLGLAGDARVVGERGTGRIRSA